MCNSRVTGLDLCQILVCVPVMYCLLFERTLKSELTRFVYILSQELIYTTQTGIGF